MISESKNPGTKTNFEKSLAEFRVAKFNLSMQQRSTSAITHKL